MSLERGGTFDVLDTNDLVRRSQEVRLGYEMTHADIDAANRALAMGAYEMGDDVGQAAETIVAYSLVAYSAPRMEYPGFSLGRFDLLRWDFEDSLRVGGVDAAYRELSPDLLGMCLQMVNYDYSNPRTELGEEEERMLFARHLLANVAVFASGESELAGGLQAMMSAKDPRERHQDTYSRTYEYSQLTHLDGLIVDVYELFGGLMHYFAGRLCTPGEMEVMRDHYSREVGAKMEEMNMYVEGLQDPNMAAFEAGRLRLMLEDFEGRLLRLQRGPNLSPDERIMLVHATHLMSQVLHGGPDDSELPVGEVTGPMDTLQLRGFGEYAPETANEMLAYLDEVIARFAHAPGIFVPGLAAELVSKRISKAQTLHSIRGDGDIHLQQCALLAAGVQERLDAGVGGEFGQAAYAGVLEFLRWHVPEAVRHNETAVTLQDLPDVVENEEAAAGFFDVDGDDEEVDEGEVAFDSGETVEVTLAALSEAQPNYQFVGGEEEAEQGGGFFDVAGGGDVVSEGPVVFDSGPTVEVRLQDLVEAQPDYFLEEDWGDAEFWAEADEDAEDLVGIDVALGWEFLEVVSDLDFVVIPMLEECNSGETWEDVRANLFEAYESIREMGSDEIEVQDLVALLGDFFVTRDESDWAVERLMYRLGELRGEGAVGMIGEDVVPAGRMTAAFDVLAECNSGGTWKEVGDRLVNAALVMRQVRSNDPVLCEIQGRLEVYRRQMFRLDPADEYQAARNTVALMNNLGSSFGELTGAGAIMLGQDFVPEARESVASLKPEPESMVAILKRKLFSVFGVS